IIDVVVPADERGNDLSVFTNGILQAYTWPDRPLSDLKAYVCLLLSANATEELIQVMQDANLSVCHFEYPQPSVIEFAFSLTALTRAQISSLGRTISIIST